MSLERFTTNDEADLWLLSHATEETRKIAVPVVGRRAQWQQDAFERAMLKEWIRLVDLDMIAAMPGVLMKVYIVTKAGEARLKELEGK